MPGIVGIISPRRPTATRRDLEAMVAAMRHDQACPVEAYQPADMGIAFARVGYPAARGGQDSVIARSSQAALAMDGEHFAHGVATHGGNSAHALLEAFESRDALGCIEQLNGWFAGVFVNRQTREVVLFNDRYGMGRLYLHEGPEELLFASEAKALLAVRPHLRSLATPALAELLRYNCVFGERTLFAQVTLLPRASAWTFANSQLQHRHQYFDFQQWENQEPLSPAEFEKEYAATVTATFPTYASGGQLVGISLTAGLDTRQIMAALGPLCSQHPCYTFDGTFGELFDTRVARKLASVHGSRFEVIRVGDSFLQKFPHYAERTVYLSDGTHDALGAHDVYLNEVARDIAPVRLTGKFGSEVVRVRNIVPSLEYPASFLRPELAALVTALPHHSQIKAALHPLTSVVANELPFHEFGRLAVERSQLVMRSPYTDNALVKLMYRAPASTRAEAVLQERYVLRHNPEFATYMTNLGRFANIGGYARNNPILTRCARFALHALFKAEYIYLYGTPHWLTALDHRLPALNLHRLLAGRQKWEGYRIWMKSHFSSFLQDTLLSSSTTYSDYFDRNAVESMLKRHIAGTHNYMSEINRVLTVELISNSLLKDRGPKTESSALRDELWATDCIGDASA